MDQSFLSSLENLGSHHSSSPLANGITLLNSLFFSVKKMFELSGCPTSSLLAGENRGCKQQVNERQTATQGTHVTVVYFCTIMSLDHK